MAGKAKRKAVTVTGASRTAAVRKHLEALRGRIETFLRWQGGRIAHKAAELYAAATKSDEDKIKRILGDLPLDWDDLSGEIRSALIAIYLEGGKAAIEKLDVEESAGFWDKLNAEALDYAEKRGAELVGKKLVDGELVDNPRAEYAITDTTRDGLRDLIAKAFDEGMTPQELSDAIQDAYDFSGARADVIARTELSFAHVEGELEAMKRSGVVSGKSLLLSDSHEIEDDCDDAEAQGVVDLGDDSIDPPLHPGCECSLTYEVEEEEEAA